LHRAYPPTTRGRLRCQTGEFRHRGVTHRHLRHIDPTRARWSPGTLPWPGTKRACREATTWASFAAPNAPPPVSGPWPTTLAPSVLAIVSMFLATAVTPFRFRQGKAILQVIPVGPNRRWRVATTMGILPTIISPSDWVFHWACRFPRMGPIVRYPIAGQVQLSQPQIAEGPVPSWASVQLPLVSNPFSGRPTTANRLATASLLNTKH
jgi:hypothetical protein